MATIFKSVRNLQVKNRFSGFGSAVETIGGLPARRNERQIVPRLIFFLNPIPKPFSIDKNKVVFALVDDVGTFFIKPTILAVAVFELHPSPKMLSLFAFL